MATDLDGLRSLIRLNTLVETDDVSDAELLTWINNGYNEIDLAQPGLQLTPAPNGQYQAGPEARYCR